eukprot:COSAG02_NODE_9126_length_2321_cov_5.033753_1_plen_377_part_10
MPASSEKRPYKMVNAREIWTEEEHRRFLEALQLYQRDWKRIAEHIGTKTVFQARSHAQKYFSKVHKHGTGEYVPAARPKRKSAAQMEKERAMAKKKKPEKERHWYSLYQNLDPEQTKRRHGHAQYAVIPTREKLPAPPPGTPNYSGRPEGKRDASLEHAASSTVRNGYGSPTRPVSLTPMMQAAAAAAHNAAVSYRSNHETASQGDAGRSGSSLNERSPALGSGSAGVQLQPSSFGSDVVHAGMATRKRKELTPDDFRKLLCDAGIQTNTPHLFKSVLGAVAPGSNQLNEDRGVESEATLDMPHPHRELAADALTFLPRQRDETGLSAQMDVSCFPNHCVAVRDQKLVPDPAKCAHVALLEAHEELRLRGLAVAFAE